MISRIQHKQLLSQENLYIINMVDATWTIFSQKIIQEIFIPSWDGKNGENIKM